MPSDANEDAQVPIRTQPAVGMPRWVKVSLIVALAAIVLVMILLATGGHGPGRHT